VAVVTVAVVVGLEARFGVDFGIGMNVTKGGGKVRSGG
jgi:hypothetical protein